MPRAMKVCSCTGKTCDAHEGSCPEIVPTGRCAACDQAAERRRGTAAQRGYDSRWEATAKAYLGTHPLCECKPDCYALATDVDHIDGLGPKGPRGHDPDNLRALSRSHHSKRTAQDQPGGWNAR